MQVSMQKEGELMQISVVFHCFILKNRNDFFSEKVRVYCSVLLTNVVEILY